jgi:hypothetical protein
VFGENAQFIGCQQLGASWCSSYTHPLPAGTDPFYQKKFVEEYAKFSKNNGMFLLFSDHYWLAYQTDTASVQLASVAKQSTNEQELRDIVKAYPDTIVIAFANNEWNEASKSKMDTWQNSLQLTTISGAKGFGLSDQSWMCNDETTCPSSLLANWAVNAFAKNAILVETEPYWYWWKFPKGVTGLQSSNYTIDSQWSDRGFATENLQALAQALGVSLPSSVLVKPTLGSYKGFFDGSLTPFISTASITKADALANCTTNHTNNPTKSIRCTWNDVEIYSYTAPVPVFDFSVNPNKTCATSSMEGDVFSVTWGTAMPTNSWINIGEDSTYSAGHFSKNISGLTGTQIPTGLQSSVTGLSLKIEPSKLYYISIYNGSTNSGTPNKTFSIPFCPASII